jgi:hypothetical protein
MTSSHTWWVAALHAWLCVHARDSCREAGAAGPPGTSTQCPHMQGHCVLCGLMSDMTHPQSHLSMARSSASRAVHSPARARAPAAAPDHDHVCHSAPVCPCPVWRRRTTAPTSPPTARSWQQPGRSSRPWKPCSRHDALSGWLLGARGLQAWGFQARAGCHLIDVWG